MNRLLATLLLIVLTWIAIELHRIQGVIKVDDFIARKIDIHLKQHEWEQVMYKRGAIIRHNLETLRQEQDWKKAQRLVEQEVRKRKFKRKGKRRKR
jgi:hypothetical protein